MTRLSDECLAEIRAWMAAGRYHGLREVLIEVDRLRATEAELHRIASLAKWTSSRNLNELRLAVIDKCGPS